MHARAFRRRAALLLFALGLACAEDAGDAPSRPRVVATIHPVALLLREIAGERVDVALLVPPRATPHTFEPLPGDVARLSRADLLVAVGGGLDAFAASLRRAAPDVRSLVLLEVPGLDPVPAVAGDDAARPDPHVWLDPIRVRDVLAPALAAALAEIDPAGAPGYAARLADFQERLTALDAEIRETLAAAPGRRYVAFHNAWRTFASRYGLSEVGVVEEFPGEEPSPHEIAALLRAARAADVPAILVEPQLDPRIARTLAAEFGGETVLVDPLGDPEDPARDTYAELLRFDARAFARALGGGR